jgi:hypothetical protein
MIYTLYGEPVKLTNTGKIKTLFNKNLVMPNLGSFTYASVQSTPSSGERVYLFID